MTNLNAVTELSSKAVVQTGYAADNVGCEITDYNLNLNLGKITIIFDETVSAASLGAGLTLQSAAQLATGVQSFTLLASTPIDVDGTSITLDIPQADLDEIARNDNLCTANGNCYLSVTT